MEEEQNEEIEMIEKSKHKLILSIVVSCGFLLAICMFMLGSQNEKYKDLELLKNIYMEERCPNNIDYYVGCVYPNIGYTDVLNLSTRTNILDKELDSKCTKGFVTCALK